MSNVTVSPADGLRQAFEHDGVVRVPGVLDENEVAEIREQFMGQVEADLSLGFDDGVPPDDPLARYPRFVQPHRTDTVVGEIARKYMLDPRIFDIVTELVGPPLGAQSMFYFKPPTARGQALHQDNFFLKTHPETCVAAWIAIDRVDGENGGLIVVPESHRDELVCPEPADPDESFSAITVPVPEGLHASQTEMQPGDVLFFHGSLIHGSPPNRSDTRFRRSLIFHYVPVGSTEVGALYQPLVGRDGGEVWIDEALGAGPCGPGFGADINH